MKIILTGKVVSKKNGKVAVNGRAFTSARFKKWEKAVLAELMALEVPRFESYPVACFCMFYVPDNVGRDMDNMLASVLDVIKDQKKRIDHKMVVVRPGVVQDDNWQSVRPIILDAAIDRLNPRVEIHLGDLTTIASVWYDHINSAGVRATAEQVG